MIFVFILLFIASLGILYLLSMLFNKVNDIEDMILNLKERGGINVFDIST